MSSTPINVQDILNRHPFSPFQWLVFALCFATLLLDGFDTAAIGFVAPALLAEWGLARPALAPVLTAALLGLAVGAVATGPMADRWGRRRVLIGSVALFGVGSSAAWGSQGLGELTALRFVAGLGLGAAAPNAVTLLSEYCPDHRRATLTNLMFCGFPLGAACGGFLAAWMIPLWGWRSVFALGGAAPLLLVAVMVWALPESLRYLVTARLPAERIRAVLRRVAPAAADGVGAAATADAAPNAPVPARAAAAPSGLGVVLSPPYRIGSLMLWTAYFMGLVIFYAIVNWLPLLLRDAGLDARTATLVSALFPLGGIGAVLSGWLMDRYAATAVVGTGFALTAVAVWAMGQVAQTELPLMSVVFVAGLLMNTAQSSLPALAAAYYPTAGRATGVAWMMGVGRLGGIAGSLLVAELARRHLGFGGIFAVVAVPGLVAAVALLVKLRVGPSAPG